MVRTISGLMQSLPDDAEFPIMVPVDYETGTVICERFSLSQDVTMQPSGE